MDVSEQQEIRRSAARLKTAAAVLFVVVLALAAWAALAGAARVCNAFDPTDCADNYDGTVVVFFVYVAIGAALISPLLIKARRMTKRIED